MTTYISDIAHYNEVLARVASVRHSLVIGTADIKDLYVKVGAGREPFLAVLDLLVRRGVEVRLLHAKEPGPNFREDFDKYPALIRKLQRKLCPRVHFKMMVFDCEVAYIGSANLTGAGIGMLIGLIAGLCIHKKPEVANAEQRQAEQNASKQKEN